MTPAAWSLLAVAGVAAVVDWLAVARGSRKVECAAKPPVVLLLAAAVATLRAANPVRQDLFVAALLASLAGDVFLMLPGDLFVPGLASFLAAQIAYASGFALHGGSASAVVLAAVPVLAAVAFPAVVILRAARGSTVRAARGSTAQAARRARHPSQALPVGVYMAAISAMVVLAVATGNPYAAGGAVLFAASDMLLGWNRFVRPLTGARLAIIVTYHLAQMALVISLTR